MNVPDPSTRPSAVPLTRCVLIVDDEDSVRLVLRRYLERRGWGVLESGDAEHALELIRDEARRVDAVVVDLHLPGISGGALCRQIAALRPQLASRIVMASGDALGAVNELAREAVYVPVIAKPFDLNDFVKVLEAVVR